MQPKQHLQMSKTKKKQLPSYDTRAINDLVAIFGVTKHFIRMSLRGDRTSLTSDKIKKEYKRLKKEYAKTSAKNRQV